MKSTVALSLLATIAFHQVVLGQDEDQQVNIATAPPAALPTLPTLITDIYWWKTLLTGDEISNYLTAPATEAPTATQEVAPSIATTDASTTTEDIISLSAAATPSDSALASVSQSLTSAISDILSSPTVASDAISTTSTVSATPSVVAWSSSSFAAVSTVILPRPSGSIIPPVTTGNPITPSNSGSNVMADLGKVLFSVTIAAVLGSFLN